MKLENQWLKLWSLILIWITLRNSNNTQQKAHIFCITNIEFILLFREIISVCLLHKLLGTYKYAVWQNAEFYNQTVRDRQTPLSTEREIVRELRHPVWRWRYKRKSYRIISNFRWTLCQSAVAPCLLYLRATVSA